MSYSHGINSARRLGDLAHLFQTDHNPTISLEMFPSPAPSQSSSTVPATEVGGEGMLGRELAAGPQRRGGFPSLLPQPLLLQATASLVPARAPSAHQPRTACGPEMGGRILLPGGRGRLGRLHAAGCGAVGAGESLATGF